jgi:hypothetical protein
MFRSILVAAGLSAALTQGPASAQGLPPVDVALVLAVDISLSMDPDEQRAQRDGYASAVGDPAVLAAVSQGPHGRIALAYVEWSGPFTQRVVAPWRVIDGPQAAAAFADEISLAPIRSGRGTSISGALTYAAEYLGSAPPATRRVIDVSGDGPNNTGAPVTLARDRVLAEGVEINGLPIMLKAPDPTFSIIELDAYYEDCVIGGPAAFVIPVTDVAGFATAIRQKLILEIAGRAPPPRLRLAQGAGPDCGVGEALYERWRRNMDP